MLTTLVLEALVLLKAILAALTRYYTAIMAKLDVIDAKLDNLGDACAAHDIEVDQRLDQIQADLNKILEAVVPSPAASIRMLIIMDGQLIKEGTLPMALTITATQKFLAPVSFVDAKGNPAVVDGSPVFTASDPAILTVVPTADPYAVEVLAVGPVGTAQLKVEADADMGAGVVPVVGLLDVVVIAGQAVGVTINAGAPVEQ